MIHDIIKKKYPTTSLVKLEGGYTNNTVLLEGIKPPLVAKIYSEHGNAASEVAALTILNDLNIAPRVHEYFEHDSTSCLIMDYLPGSVGQRFLDCGDMPKTRDMYRQLGTILAEHVHFVCVDAAAELPMLELVHSNMDSFVPADLLDEVRRALDVGFTDVVSLVHGDFGPQNIIVYQTEAKATDNAKITDDAKTTAYAKIIDETRTIDNIKIVDWEFAGWGNPLFDIAWVVWFVHLHYPRICKEMSAIFLREYRTHSDICIDKKLLKAFAVSRVVFILGLISMDNVPGRTEWIRRLTWTLGVDFMG